MKQQQSAALSDLSPATFESLSQREIPLPVPQGVGGPKGEARVLEFATIDGGELKVNRKKRTVEGFAAVFENVDDGGDRLLSGSADRTVAEDGPEGSNQIKTFWQHSEGIGMPVLMDPQPQALYTRSKVTDHPDLDLYLALIEGGVADKMSIGWSPREWKFVEEDDLLVREVSDFELFEVSVVYWGMNRLARVTALKDAGLVAAKGGPLAEALRHVFAGQLLLQSQELSHTDAKAARDVMIEIGQRASEGLKHLGFLPEVGGGNPAPKAKPTGGDPGDGDLETALDALLSKATEARDEAALIRREYAN